MDRHDAKPRRPSLMAGAEPQCPAPGARPARILADLTPAAAPRRSRRPVHGRAVLIGGLGLIALAAVGWTLIGSGNDLEPPPSEALPAITEQAAVDPSTATLVDAAPSDGAAIANPFENESGPQGASPDPAPATADAATGEARTYVIAKSAVTANPFSSVNEMPARGKPGASVPGGPAPASVAPKQARPRATPTPQSTPVTSRAPAPPRAAGGEAGLLQTLMDNIQQPVAPARDTQAMDRLARRLDRTPMPEPAPGVVAGSAAATATTSAHSSPTPTAGTTAPEKQSLRELLSQCPASTTIQGQRCRRQMCGQAGVEPYRCMRL